MTRKVLLVLIGVLVACAAADAQWIKSYGGPTGNVEGLRVRALPSGGFYLCGSTSSFGRSYEGKDCWVARLDANGHILWQRELPFPQWPHETNGGADQAAVDLVPDGDLGCTLVGKVSGFSNDTEGGILVVKFSANGRPLWQSCYYEGQHWGSQESGRSICASPGGGVAVAGTFDNATEVFAIKNGAKAWTGYFEPDAWSLFHPQCIRPASDGGYVLAGVAVFPGKSDRNAWVVRLSESGRRVLWQRSIGGPGADDAASVLEAPDGGFVVAGTTRSFGAGETDAWVFKLSRSGDIVWQYAYGRERDDYAHEIHPTPDGGFIVSGSTRDPDGTALHAFLMKLGPDGRPQWNRVYPGLLQSSGWSVDLLPAGYVLAGRTQSRRLGRWSAMLVTAGLDGNVPGAPGGAIPMEVRPAAAINVNTYRRYSRVTNGGPVTSPLPWTDTNVVERALSPVLENPLRSPGLFRGRIRD